MTNGKVFLVGAGPGDLELLTLKALDCIQKADVLLYDRLINKEILKHARKDAEIIHVGKGHAGRGITQKIINNLLIEKFKEDKIIVRLKGGDPFLFGRGGEEAELLSKNKIDFEIVPGIPSAISVPAYAGIPITHRNYSSELHIFTGHKKAGQELNIDFNTIAKLKGTLVFLMGVKNLKIIVKNLLDSGKDIKTPIAIITNGTKPSQKVKIGTLETILNNINENIVPPSIIVIGGVVNLYKDLNWYSKKKLHGRTILITRDKNQAFEFSAKLQKYGAEVIEEPFIEIIDNSSLLNEIDFAEYSVILFNSANGVNFFFKRIADVRKILGVKIGVIGERTHLELKKHKIIADFMPDDYTVNDLIELSLKFVKKDEKVLVITSNLSQINPDLLYEKYKIIFKKLEIYKTKMVKKTQKQLEDLFKNKIDIITFLSSSTVESFFNNLQSNFIDYIKDIKIASIGPETTKRIEAFEVHVDIEAKYYTTDGLIEVIINNQ